jgi:NAD(P)-dependent dehydrogenase (short-subunit alcohol dehydrogenase family)
MSNRLKDKVAIVTGAASGLGKASAEMFARQGASVVCADINGEGAALTAKEIGEAGGRAVGVQVDLVDDADAKRMTDLALSTFGQVDIVFACAGIAGIGTAGDTSMEEWQRVNDVNLTSKWLSFKHAIPNMVERGSGSIIVQTSIGGMIGVPGIFPYAAAKAGCIGMVKQAAVEYGPSGLRVNGIAPGNVPTPLVVETYRRGGGMGAAGSDSVEEGFKKAAAMYPLRRLGEPEDVANLATFVASDESSWITGHIFVIDGGVSIQ